MFPSKQFVTPTIATTSLQEAQWYQASHTLSFPANKNATFEKNLIKALILSSNNPEKRGQIGIFWIDNLLFAANSKILGKTIGLKPNSVNYNLRHHQLVFVGKMPSSYTHLPEEKNWKILKHKSNLFSQELVNQGKTNLLKWEKKITVKNKKKMSKDNQKNNNQINQYLPCSDAYDGDNTDFEDYDYDFMDDNFNHECFI